MAKYRRNILERACFLNSAESGTHRAPHAMGDKIAIFLAQAPAVVGDGETPEGIVLQIEVEDQGLTTASSSQFQRENEA